MKKISVFIVILLGFVGSYFFLQNDSTKTSTSLLKVGYPGEWNDLIPSLQHTAYADALMHNQFEPLVIIGRGGTVQAMAAKSWLISKDKKVFTFDIDTSRKFSNGTKLSAQHFKDSWEYSLKIDSKSANNSLLDVLYKIEGFEDHKKNGGISGVKVINSKTLEVTFKKSFRMGLSHLAGTRMAAFLKINDEYLGTGPYVINKISKEEVLLTKNEYDSNSVPFDKVSVKVVPTERSHEALKKGEIDLYAFAEVAQVDSCHDELMNCVSGTETRHIALVLNGQEGRLLNNPNHRKAFQSLFFDGFSVEDFPRKDRLKSQIDPQIFLPLQAGHIPVDKAQKIIDEGKPFVDAFIKATQSQPIYLAHTKGTVWFKNYLKKKGVRLSDKTETVKGGELLNMYYKTYAPDVLPMYLSVFSGDPDGIYHALGKNGAISSPMLHRKEVTDLLEEGRKILDFDKVAPHYEKLTESVLKEVPFIHVGFLKDVVILRKDHIEVDTTYVNRESGRFTNYKPVGK